MDRIQSEEKPSEQQNEKRIRTLEIAVSSGHLPIIFKLCLSSPHQSKISASDINLIVFTAIQNRHFNLIERLSLSVEDPIAFLSAAIDFLDMNINQKLCFPYPEERSRFVDLLANISNPSNSRSLCEICRKPCDENNSGNHPLNSRCRHYYHASCNSYSISGKVQPVSACPLCFHEQLCNSIITSVMSTKEIESTLELLAQAASKGHLHIVSTMTNHIFNFIKEVDKTPSSTLISNQSKDYSEKWLSAALDAILCNAIIAGQLDLMIGVLRSWPDPSHFLSQAICLAGKDKKKMIYDILLKKLDGINPTEAAQLRANFSDTEEPVPR
jgi:hypothetical protein